MIAEYLSFFIYKEYTKDNDVLKFIDISEDKLVLLKKIDTFNEFYFTKHINNIFTVRQIKAQKLYDSLSKELLTKKDRDKKQILKI